MPAAPLIPQATAHPPTYVPSTPEQPPAAHLVADADGRSVRTRERTANRLLRVPGQAHVRSTRRRDTRSGPSRRTSRRRTPRRSRWRGPGLRRQDRPPDGIVHALSTPMTAPSAGPPRPGPAGPKPRWATAWSRRTASCMSALRTVWWPSTRPRARRRARPERDNGVRMTSWLGPAPLKALFDLVRRHGRGSGCVVFRAPHMSSSQVGPGRTRASGNRSLAGATGLGDRSRHHRSRSCRPSSCVGHRFGSDREVEAPWLARIPSSQGPWRSPHPSAFGTPRTARTCTLTGLPPTSRVVSRPVGA